MNQRSDTTLVETSEIREQLERILASGTFARATRLSLLLRYVVAHALGENGQSLKEYTLGLEVFERGASFDPRTDTIVRVQARRLRARLARYYETEGRGDPCLIEIPRGGYQPEFHLREPLPEPLLPTIRPTDPEAHRLLLEGRVLVNQGTPKKLMEAVRLFEKAIALDARYASAHSELAHAHAQLSSLHCAPHEAMPKAREAALRALELDDSLDQAYAVLGMVRLYYDWDRDGARQAARLAIERNPRSSHAYRLVTATFNSECRTSEAREAISHALELAPLDTPTNFEALATEILARDYDAAIAQAEQTLRIAPEFTVARSLMGMTYILNGSPERGIEELRAAVEQDWSPWPVTFLQNGYAIAGRTDEALKLMPELEQGVGRDYVCAYEIAQCYSVLEDLDQAFDWFSKAVEQRSDCMVWVEAEPWLDCIRDDPRYRTLMDSTGLVSSAEAQSTP